MLNQVLVVDDVGYTRALFQHALNGEGYDVCCAETGMEALRCIENELPSLVILDINLPDISGIEVLEEMRRKKHKTPVIIITARDDETFLQKAVDLGVYAFLTKPVDLNEFLALLPAIFDPTSHILIVDDEELTVQLYTNVLKAEGYRTSSSTNGEEALKLLRYRHYDAAVLDLNLPGIDGVEILRQVRALGETLPIVITSAYADQSTEKQLQEYKIDGFLEKPIDTSRLIMIIKNLVGTVTSRAENDFSIYDFEGRVRNSLLLKRLISQAIKKKFTRFIFNLTKVTSISKSIEETLLTILGKNILASRIVLTDDQQIDFLKSVQPSPVFRSVDLAKRNILEATIRQEAIDEELSVKPEKAERVRDLTDYDGETYLVLPIPKEEMEVGMILANPISNESGKVVLLSEGVTLTAKDIERILELEHVTDIFIKQKHFRQGDSPDQAPDND